jgi:hypothetical protein
VKLLVLKLINISKIKFVIKIVNLTNHALNVIKIVRLVLIQQKMVAYLVKMEDYYILKLSKNVMSILAIVKNLFLWIFLD